MQTPYELIVCVSVSLGQKHFDILNLRLLSFSCQTRILPLPVTPVAVTVDVVSAENTYVTTDPLLDVSHSHNIWASIK